MGNPHQMSNAIFQVGGTGFFMRETYDPSLMINDQNHIRYHQRSTGLMMQLFKLTISETEQKAPLVVKLLPNAGGETEKGKRR